MPDEDKRFLFYDLNQLPSWMQYTIAAKSLLKSLDLDNPEDPLLVQLTLSELSVVTVGLISLCRMFPEFEPVASLLSNKLSEIGQSQGFLRAPSVDGEDV